MGGGGQKSYVHKETRRYLLRVGIGLCAPNVRPAFLDRSPIVDGVTVRLTPSRTLRLRFLKIRVIAPKVLFTSGGASGRASASILLSPFVLLQRHCTLHYAKGKK
jgi:hypothetical protein